MEIRHPNKSQAAAIAATIIAIAAPIAQYYGVTAPNTVRADANREANWSARDQLQVCNDARDRWEQTYIAHMEDDH